MILIVAILALLVGAVPPLAWADFRILALGDSNTWGSNASGPRHDDDVRWGRVLDGALPNAVVVVEGRIGRRTDLGKGRALDNIGKPVTSPIPELAGQHLPLDLAVVMLGTNDLQSGQGRDADEIARSAFSLARILLDGGIDQVLVVTPPPLTNPERGGLSGIFGRSQDLSEELATAYARLSREIGIPVFDAGMVTRADGADGVHLTVQAQRPLGMALVPVVQDLLPDYR